MTPLQQAAIEYLQAGLHILALSGKRPNGRVHGESWSWDDSFFNDDGMPLTDLDYAAIEQAFSEAKGTTGIAILIPPDFLVADVDSERAAKLLKDLGFQKTRRHHRRADQERAAHLVLVARRRPEPLGWRRPRAGPGTDPPLQGARGLRCSSTVCPL